MATSHLIALKLSLHALAQPAAFQQRLLSVWLEDVAELPERFVQAERHLIEGDGHSFNDEQRESLAALHARFETFSGPTNAEHWQEEALGWSSHWSAIRELAGQCLVSFGWANEQPPLETACYGEDYCR